MRSSATIDVVNPATLDLVATIAATQPDQLDAIVETASRVQIEWARMSQSERGALLNSAIAEVESAADRIAELLTAEQGKPIGDARTEVTYVVRAMQHFAGMSNDSPWRTEQSRRTRVVFQPLGTVGAIVPWNWPLVLLAWKVCPAIMAGNSIVVKPAPTTPLSTVELIAALERALPKGLITLVHGGAEIGNAMVSHPGLAKISFTGSTPTGKAIMSAGASTLKRLTLELGGNDAALILPDTNLDEVLPKIFYMAFNNSGQTCVAVKRVYVPVELEQEVVDRLLDMASTAIVGNGADPSTQFGPLHMESQRAKVQAMLDQATSLGAQALAPGASIAGLPGYFMRPTIVTGSPDDADIVAQEQFGPALPVQSYTSIDEAITRVNSTQFDLGSSVWGSDVDAATAVAERVQAGSVWVNQHAAMDVSLPFGGLQHSGLGQELGPHALQEYSACKVVNVRV